MSKSIYEKQNEPQLIDYLCAQRKGYSNLKIFNGIRYSLTIGITTLLTVLLFIFDEPRLEAFSTILAVIIIIIDKYCDYFVEIKQIVFAKIQQYFDICCFNEVLNVQILQLSSIFSKSEIAELTSDNYDKKLRDGVFNWYQDYSTCTPIEQVFYCQKTNIRWNKKNNRRFNFVNIVMFFVIIFTIFLFGIIRDITLLKLIGIISCGLTFFDFALDLYLKLRNDFNKIKQAEKLAYEIEEKLSSLSDYEEIIELQTIIFDYRCECLCVPDFFYNLFKSRDDKKEDKIAKNLKGFAR